MKKIYYVGVSKEALFRDSISLQAKGLYSYLTALGGTYSGSQNQLAKECGCGTHAINSYLKQLRENGLLTYQKFNDGTGIYSVVEVAV